MSNVSFTMNVILFILCICLDIQKIKSQPSWSMTKLTAVVFRDYINEHEDCPTGHKIKMEYSKDSNSTPQLQYEQSIHAYYVSMQFTSSDHTYIGSLILEEHGDNRFYDYIPIRGNLKTAFVIGDFSYICKSDKNSYTTNFNLFTAYCGKYIQNSNCYKHLNDKNGVPPIWSKDGSLNTVQDAFLGRGNPTLCEK